MKNFEFQIENEKNRPKASAFSIFHLKFEIRNSLLEEEGSAEVVVLRSS